VRSLTPTYTRVVIDEPDPDPVGSDMVDRLDSIYGLAAWGVVGGGPPAFGPTGDDSRSSSADLGAIQGMAPGSRGRGTRNYAAGDREGLPITRVPSSSLVDASPLSVQAQFGVR
jgi:hypothetical protein